MQMLLIPLDALKTMMQVEGSAGTRILLAKLKEHGVFALWDGATVAALSMIATHYPWYLPHKRLPPLFFCNNLSRYKDNASNPDASRGWSSDRCALLGASLVDALSYVQPYLRHSGSFWESLPACDAYVAPRDIDGLPTHELNS